MAENRITTLSDFFAQSGAEYRLFDMGRRVSHISAQTFIDFENATTPYPMPFQRSALFGVLFWNPEQTNKHYVWFLKFPLDEQGLLIQAARDEFLVMVLERVGETMLAAEDGKQIQGALKDSPYSWKPREDKMSAFNAQATYNLSLAPSSFYLPAKTYFSGELPVDNWQKLGMQGVADVAIRLQNEQDIQALKSFVPELPDEPFQMLSTFLENRSIPITLVTVFAHLLNTELNKLEPNLNTVNACLRAVSASEANEVISQMFTATLSHPISQQVEVLAVIVGRCWQFLVDPNLCKQFLERLAINEAGSDGFTHLLADLIFLPNMRPVVMTVLRDPERSEALSQQIGPMFS